MLANNATGLLSFRREVIEALIKDGNEVAVSVPASNRSDDIRGLGCRLVEVQNINRHGTNPMTDLALLREYKKLIREVKPDVILTYTIKPNIYGGIAAMQAGVPYVVNITGLGTAVENSGLLQKVTVGLYRYAMRKAHCIFFQNEGNRQFFASRGIRNDAHRLIPGSGVSLDRFMPSLVPDNEPVRFNFISRLMKQKGIEEYFAAAEHFKAAGKNVEFHILGASEESYSERLKELQDRNIVIYHGLQKDVRPFIEKSHCLIHPTYYPEGMSNVVLESAASGRPVITTRRYGCMEAVEDGVTGFLFAERDREGLFAAIDRFLTMTPEDRSEMGCRAREKMKREFDRRIVIEAYRKAIAECQIVSSDTKSRG